MARQYKVVDADGHILEPLDLWDHYIDPAFRDRAPQLITDTDGKQRLLIEERVIGSSKGIGLAGAIGARDGVVCDDTMEYSEGRAGGFDPPKRVPDQDMGGEERG